AVGFGAGVVSTALMSILQLPFWRRWSVVGVLEWHENVCIAARVFNRRPEEMLAHSFLFHFLNGGLASMFYALAVHGLGFLKWLDVWVLGVLFGLFLWIATLAPIHKPITGVSITRHPLGPWPAAVSILLHIVYGLSTAYVAELAL
ncbi:MAG: hypothetical protein RMH74_06160, partial [Candidatus Caldarchaeum sp.]|nr:hypothetical protein [Candidatus Caldarchaeum sp.]